MTILIKKRYEVLRRPGRARRKPPPRPGPIERFDDGRFVRIERDIAELKADASDYKWKSPPNWFLRFGT